jgi:hypothetical protein
LRGNAARRWDGRVVQGQGGCFTVATAGLCSLQGERINAKIKFDCWSKDFYQQSEY